MMGGQRVRCELCDGGWGLMTGEGLASRCRNVEQRSAGSTRSRLADELPADNGLQIDGDRNVVLRAGKRRGDDLQGRDVKLPILP